VTEETRASATWEWEGGSSAPWTWTSATDRAAISAALAAGQLTVADPVTGYHKSLYAPCPRDGHTASVWRVERGAQHAITALTMRCPDCGTEFRPAVESLFAR
jgi:hypothetical protein